MCFTTLGDLTNWVFVVFQFSGCKNKAYLTHWGRVTHICVGNLTIIGSECDLSPDRRQAIILTNAWILLTGPLGTNFSEISIEIQTFSFKKMRLKVSSAKWRPFYLGLNVLILQHILWWKLDDETASVMRRYHIISNTTFTADWSPWAYSLFDSDMTMVTSADRNVLWNQRSSCWITITPKITSTFKITFQVSPSNPTRLPFVVLSGTQQLAIAASSCNSGRSLFDWAADESR